MCEATDQNNGSCEKNFREMMLPYYLFDPHQILYTYSPLDGAYHFCFRFVIISCITEICRYLWIHEGQILGFFVPGKFFGGTWTNHL